MVHVWWNRAIVVFFLKTNHHGLCRREIHWCRSVVQRSVPVLLKGALRTGRLKDRRLNIAIPANYSAYCHQHEVYPCAALLTVIRTISIMMEAHNGARWQSTLVATAWDRGKMCRRPELSRKFSMTLDASKYSVRKRPRNLPSRHQCGVVYRAIARSRISTAQCFAQN